MSLDNTGTYLPLWGGVQSSSLAPYILKEEYIQEESGKHHHNQDDKKRKVPSELEKLKEDSEFQEFLSVYQKWTQVVTWTNDALDTEPLIGKGKLTSDYLNFDSDSGQESEEEEAKDPAEEESEDEAVNCDEGSEAEESSATETQQARGSTGALPGNRRPQETLGKNEEEEEDLADSGRLFVRNVPYSSTEEDLEGLFSSYGPLSELHYPIDSLTKEPRGRMLHVLPSTIRKEASEEADTPGSSYKKKAASKDKGSSSSSHNWNTLFMGPNAMAKAITQKYSGTKSQVLDHEINGSVAVRVAPGETQLVQEVQYFLLHNGVSLDSFSQATAERNKTVILAKNLPTGTLAAELRETFGHFGSLGQVLLPKGGVTAIIVEFLEPLDACRAFRHLAYSKVGLPQGIGSWLVGRPSA
ncbi:putative RNA-binding protein 19 [Sciurus carolinensis]|uniref:RNA-binding protein 19 n=1 Tax=Sciurus carolinensis TaxID=30640 RepID=A0AA41N025_SCICA|nr:putative RNA-binding protein 19 [Sciurus carolinensis]